MWSFPDVLAQVVILLDSPMIAGAIATIFALALVPRMVSAVRYIMTSDPYGNRDRSYQRAHEQLTQAEAEDKTPPATGNGMEDLEALGEYFKHDVTVIGGDDGDTHKLPPAMTELVGILPQVTYQVHTDTVFTCVHCGHALPYIPGTQGKCICGANYTILGGG